MTTMQKKWFRIETDASGAILSCDEVDSKGRQGAIVRYYEALTKAEACEKAKEWAARYRASATAHTMRRQESAKANGYCINCYARPRVNASRCEICRDKFNARKRELRSGSEPLIRKLSDDQLLEHVLRKRQRARDKAKQKWGSYRSVEVYLMLSKLDTVGPDAFRAYLCDRIRKAGGGAALDEYEHELNKKYEKVFENAVKRCEERYPPEAAE